MASGSIAAISSAAVAKGVLHGRRRGLERVRVRRWRRRLAEGVDDGRCGTARCAALHAVGGRVEDLQRQPELWTAVCVSRDETFSRRGKGGIQVSGLCLGSRSLGSVSGRRCRSRSPASCGRTGRSGRRCAPAQETDQSGAEQNGSQNIECEQAEAHPVVAVELDRERGRLRRERVVDDGSGRGRAGRRRRRLPEQRRRARRCGRVVDATLVALRREVRHDLDVVHDDVEAPSAAAARYKIHSDVS